jgi:hypothetical protein
MRWQHRQHRDVPGKEQERWPSADELCEETGACLRGRSAELFVGRDEAVPSWALLNAPAHRSLPEVLDLAALREGRWHCHT